jgi:hypothetical protein
MIVKRCALAAFLPCLAMATMVMKVYNFGQFGQSLAEAKKTEFFTFFHLVETGREDHGSYETIRCQPSGPKFHDLVGLPDTSKRPRCTFHARSLTARTRRSPATSQPVFWMQLFTMKVFPLQGT